MRIAIALLVVGLAAGCFDSDAVKVGAKSPLLVQGYGYDGLHVQRINGSLDVRLAPDSNSGHARAEYNDLFHAHTLTWTSYRGRAGYQSGGVASDIDLWGATGNGSSAFPKMRVHVAAFGPVRATVDGDPEHDPRTARDTFTGVLFVTEGRYRDPESMRVDNAERTGAYDPNKPDDAYINRIGAQAVLLVFTERGDLYRHLDYQDVQVRHV